MTLLQVLDTTNEYRRLILKGNARYRQERRHGIAENRYVTDRDLLRLEFLNSVIAGNEGLTITGEIQLPSWLPAELFDASFSSILKRLKNVK